MKILAISGSPRKGGNTEYILEEVLKSAQEKGAETEMISVVGKELKPCEACEYCAEHKICKIDDDAHYFYEKILDADGVVMGSPVYFGNVSCQLKAIIDRQRVVWRQGKSFKDKIGASVAVGWKWGHFSTLATIDSFFMTNKMLLTGIGGVPGIGLMVFAQKKGDAKKDESAIKNAQELGKRMVEAVKAFQKI
ncbi:MAG: flavodoxin family protein [Candidatus Methanofastidiosia archaeon]